MSATETYELALPEVTLPKPQYVSYGLPFDEACKRHVEETFQAKRVYIIASGGLTRSSNALTRLTDALGPRVAAVHIGVAPHTPFTAVIDIAREVREKAADCIITLGGGSLSDAAKLIILVAANPDKDNCITELYDTSIGSVKDFHDNDLPGANLPTIPIICVPTSLSAGEYSRVSGATDPETHIKWQFFHARINPNLVVLDPALSKTTPEWVWISTGVRAMDHCTEALSNIQGNEIVDPVAAEALGNLAAGLLKSKKDLDDVDARMQCQLAARRAMLSLNMKVNIGASHGIGHMLGPMGVGHGQTSCILLPAVMKYNKPVNESRQELVKQALWAKDAVAQVLTGRGLEKQNSDASDALGAIFDELKMPRTLKDVGIGRDRFGELAKASLHDRCLKSNPRPITQEEQVMEIIEMVAGDQ